MKILGGAIQYHILVEYDGELFVVEDCRFLKNFGPWVKGESVFKLQISFESCTIIEYSIDGVTELRRGTFSIHPT